MSSSATVVRSGTVYAGARLGAQRACRSRGPRARALNTGIASRPAMRAVPSGRTRTAPRRDARLERMRIASRPASNTSTGYYIAYRHMLDDHLDLIVHVGDYIYELTWGRNTSAVMAPASCYTLVGLPRPPRALPERPDLQAAHAAVSVARHVGRPRSRQRLRGRPFEEDDDPALFLARRAAAYRAYYEHMPLPRRAAPFGADMRLYASCRFADLLALHLLDERQYRIAARVPARRSRGLDPCASRRLPGVAR